MDYRIPFLPDEHHFAIAAVAVRGGLLDTTLEYVVRMALDNLPETARYALKNLGGDRVVGFARAALEDSFPEELVDIADVFKKLGDARSTRNEIVHWYWAQHDTDPSLAEIARIRPFREIERRPVSARQIIAIAEELEAAEAAIFSWFSRLQQAISVEPSPDIPEPPARLASSPSYTGYGLLGTSPPPDVPRSLSPK